MDRLRSIYRNSKFRTKLLWIFVLSSLLPVSAILIISARLNTRNMTDKVNELMVTSLTQIAQRVNLNLEIYTNMLYQIYQDELITDNVKILMGDKRGQAVAYNKINDRLKQYNTTESGVRCISVICADGHSVVYDFGTASSIRNLWSPYKDLRLITPFVDAKDQPGMVITPTMTFDEKGKKRHYFHISKRIFDLDNLDQGSIATVVMTVDEKVLDGICNAASQQNGGSGINFIMSKDHTVITYPDEDFSGLRKNPQLSVEGFVKVSGLMKNRNMAVNAYEDPVTGWMFYNAYDRDAMLADVKSAQHLYVLIGIAAISFASVMILLLVRQINRSVSSVVAGIKEVQNGNLDVSVPVTRKDEIGEITENFNDMTVKVKNLVREVKRATDMQKDAEIRALEAQINPHFLYNTLDSINWMAIEHGEYEISKMLRNLGVILRYSVSGSNQTVTVRELADWLDKYIGLHQMRFDGVFTYRLRIQPEAEAKKIYKLLLQPFIENAILHGFKGMEGEGILSVDISCSEDGGMLHVIVEDNGAGMAADRLKQYNDPDEAVKDDGRGIGLHNAFSRMRMYYGQRAVWNVNSIEGMGTVVTLKLPALN